MNRAHRCLCDSAPWRRHMQATLVPWVLAMVPRAPQGLEIGPGPGATTEVLLDRVDALTCVEIDRERARRLAGRYGPRVRVLCEDAAAMSLPSASCDLAVAIAMLHHVPSPMRQDLVLRELARVLRPGGVLAGYEIRPGLVVRALHWRDTLTLVDPAGLPARLARLGFVDTAIEQRGGGFRFRAAKAA